MRYNDKSLFVHFLKLLFKMFQVVYGIFLTLNSKDVEHV